MEYRRALHVPPFFMIPWCLLKIQNDSATVTLITYPTMADMSMVPPYVVNVDKSTSAITPHTPTLTRTS